MPESRTSRIARGFGAAVLIFSATLWATTTLCFIGRWDQVAAVTVLPQWAWASMGLFSAALASRLRQERVPVSRMIIILWLLSTVCFADNLLPLIRGLFHGSACKRPSQNGTLRIVTLNCASSPLAAAEVMKFHPDIVLLQESPPINTIAELARAWYGNSASFVAGLDCAIVSHYPLKAIEDHAPNHYRHAIATISSDRAVLVTSLRLTPPLGRVDLWNPAIWRAYREERRYRRRQLQTAQETASSRKDLPHIIGGDFNAPAWDGIYKILSLYRDSHRTSGRGWGNTALNSIPLFRPDRIWLKDLSPICSQTIQTVHSDHRMVVTDAILRR